MKLPSRIGAGGNGPRDVGDLLNQLSDAVYLTDQAAKNHKDDVRPAAPRIRVQPERVRTDLPAVTNKGLMSRWFTQRSKIPSSEDPDYQPAKIERPVRRKAAPAPAPLPVKKAASIERDPLPDTSEPPTRPWFRLRRSAPVSAPQEHVAARSAPPPPPAPKAPASEKKAPASEKKRGRFPFGKKSPKEDMALQPVWKPVKRKKIDRGDVTVAALGITLGLTCALFPWYIFLNQEKFGVREMVFEGSREGSSPAQVAFQPPLVGKPFRTGEAPRMNLDFFPTATLPAEPPPTRIIPPVEQPFPSDLVSFKLVHVANGRAMIEDVDGLWVVQPGSRLPDASQVTAIEKRNGNWVLVTSLDKIVELQP